MDYQEDLYYSRNLKRGMIGALLICNTLSLTLGHKEIKFRRPQESVSLSRSDPTLVDIDLKPKSEPKARPPVEKLPPKKETAIKPVYEPLKPASPVPWPEQKPFPPVDSKGEENPPFVQEVATPPIPVNGYEAIQKAIRYPQLALRLRLEGRVVIRVFIDTTGNVSKLELVDPAEFDPFNEAAREAIKRVAWIPGRQGEQDVGAWVSVAVRFTLR